jgi:hypothetical protein
MDWDYNCFDSSYHTYMSFSEFFLSVRTLNVYSSRDWRDWTPLKSTQFQKGGDSCTWRGGLREVHLFTCTFSPSSLVVTNIKMADPFCQYSSCVVPKSKTLSLNLLKV